MLTVLRILIRDTDEGKTLTTPELIELLNGQGITADRRSIYEDIEAIYNAGGKCCDRMPGKGVIASRPDSLMTRSLA